MFHTQRRQTNSTDVRGGPRSAPAHTSLPPAVNTTRIYNTMYVLSKLQVKPTTPAPPRAHVGSSDNTFTSILLIQPTHEYIHTYTCRGNKVTRDYSFTPSHSRPVHSLSAPWRRLVVTVGLSIEKALRLLSEIAPAIQPAPFHPRTGAELLTWPQTCPALQHNKRHLVTQLAGFMTQNSFQQS